MKTLVIGDAKRVAKYLPDLPIVEQVETIVVGRGTPDGEIIEKVGDADFIVADAVSPVSAQLMDAFPSLKLIHSEGVAYNAIDVDAAQKRNITVCNNAGVNAGAVAEQAVLLMLACLRHVVEGDAAVLGKQTGMDAQRGKMTWPALMGVDGAKERSAKAWDEALAAIEPFGARAQFMRTFAQQLRTRTK